MELSIIIPIYKTEEYLAECVNSILSQKTRDLEVILIDDGSPDNCPAMCDEFAKADSRVKVVHKENGGLSSARNVGLKVATGKYVAFVDSDDKLFPSSIQEILLWIKSNNEDICFLKVLKLYPDGSKRDLGEVIHGSQLKAHNKEDVVAYLASGFKYPGSAWGKLFRREFLLENDLHFPYDRRYSEDLGFIRDCILYADSFDSLDVQYYQYRQGREGSITNKISAKNFYDLFKFVNESAEKLTVDKKAKDSVSTSLMCFVAYEYSILLYLYSLLPELDKKTAFEKLKEYKWILRFTGNKKGKAIFFVCNVFGIRFTSLLMKQYRKFAEK